jgi:hypothetical protein
MVHARFDEPLWTDAKRTPMKEAFVQERGDVEEPAAD